MSKTIVKKDAIEAQIDKLSNQIDYKINEYTIGFLADEMEKGDDGIFYIPDYQREYIWNRNDVSRFIESIIMGLPIPFIFYYENIETGKLEIYRSYLKIGCVLKLLFYLNWDFLPRITRISTN